MKKATLESKDLPNLSEPIEHFKLSRRKFYALLKEKSENNFIVLYGQRRLIIRTAFDRYLQHHLELRRCR